MRRKQSVVKHYRCKRAVSVQAGCSNPPSKLNGVEGKLRSLYEKHTLARFVDNAQDDEDVSGLLEDLQEAVNDYLVRSLL